MTFTLHWSKIMLVEFVCNTLGCYNLLTCLPAPKKTKNIFDKSYQTTGALG